MPSAAPNDRRRRQHERQGTRRAANRGYLAGAFDLLSWRDLELISRTRRRCAHLTVGVHTDELVVRTLGQHPIVPLKERAEVVSHVRGVDEVVIQHELDPRFTRLSADGDRNSRTGPDDRPASRSAVGPERAVDHEVHHDDVAALRAGSRPKPRRTTSGREPVVGYVPGAWDMFHVGHLNILTRAREQCDVLVVGAVTDEELSRVKGQLPIVPLAERKELLASMDLVDLVVTDYSTDKLDVWRRVGFDVLFKGDDWKGTPKGDLLEQRMSSAGVEVCYFPYTRYTPSTRLRQLLNRTDANT